MPPREARRTVTLVFANVVKASATIVTGARGTGVWLSNLTVSPSEAIRAGAVVLIACLFARAPVPAGPGAAEVRPSFLAVPAVESTWALARVRVVVGIAGTSIKARVGVAG